MGGGTLERLVETRQGIFAKRGDGDGDGEGDGGHSERGERAILALLSRG
jgi:hypothetical protein